MGSVFELECEVILSRDRSFITETSKDRTLAAVDEVRRMLLGLIDCLVTEELQETPDS
jgi:hypothetical protein